MSASEFIDLRPQPLTTASFTPFGEVIERDDSAAQSINQGTAQKSPDLAKFDVTDHGGRPSMSIYRADARPLPFVVSMLERHPIGSQFFYPLQPYPYLVIAAPSDAEPQPNDLHAFIAKGNQGINLHRGTWHHPLFALVPSSDYLVIDRIGPGRNTEEHRFEHNTGPMVRIMPCV